MQALAESLDDRFEELVNDVSLGAVIARSFEQVEKVATALSAGNKGVITEEMLMWSFCFVQRAVKTKSLKALAEAIARSNGEDFSYGAKTLVSPVIQSLMASRAIDAVGCGYWINDASKFEGTKMSVKFTQIVDGIGMNMAAMRGWR